MSTASCPACESKLDFEPWTGDSASDEICPSCGIQFGYNDARADLREKIYGEWRKAWIANGRKPFHGQQWHDLSRRIIQEANNVH
jgi:Zn ribbon nucleic-acid-binding protein